MCWSTIQPLHRLSMQSSFMHLIEPKLKLEKKARRQYLIVRDVMLLRTRASHYKQQHRHVRILSTAWYAQL